MELKIYNQDTKTGLSAWLRLHEKGGKRHEVPRHHNLAAYLDAWIEAARDAGDKRPAFPSCHSVMVLVGRIPSTALNFAL